MSETAAIVLAAGKSTRMKSEQPKVLHKICGRPMLSFVLGACRLAGVDRLLVVVGHEKDRVRSRCGDKDITWVEQREQKGTGHAVQCCRSLLDDFTGSVLVVAGDMPLIQRATLVELLEHRARSQEAMTMATTILADPTGYGRIIRDDCGNLEAIVEDRDCTAAQQKIGEVNPSYYCFDGRFLFEALDRIEPALGTHETYLTDVVAGLRGAGRKVSACVRTAAEESMGVNSRLDLAKVGRVMQDRIQLSLMQDGVTIVDPDNTWIEADVTIGRETTIEPFSVVRTGATIGAGCHIGPFACVAAGEALQDGTEISFTTRRGAQVQ